MAPTPPHAPVPNHRITAFDRAEYDKLIDYIVSVDRDLNTNLAKPRPGVRLDDTLGGGIHPGSLAWSPAKGLNDSAVAFGRSVKERYRDLSKDWEQYITALRNARDVFESTGNLSTYSASKFVTDFPDVSPGAKSSSGGGPP
jgi:hypothetical protein